MNDLDREIELARLRYWQLIAQKRLALGLDMSQIVTAESQYVDVDGKVWFGGQESPRLVGKVEPHREGWATWGLEAAGPPFSPPPNNVMAWRARKRKAAKT